MRLIKRGTLREYATTFPQSASALDRWTALTLAAAWQKLNDTRKTFPHADAVKVKSGRTVTVFNVCGNDFRLITAIHYDRAILYVLRFLTHAEYSKNNWKNDL